MWPRAVRIKSTLLPVKHHGCLSREWAFIHTRRVGLRLKKIKGTGDGLEQADYHQTATPDWENSWQLFSILVIRRCLIYYYSFEAPNDLNNVNVRDVAMRELCCFVYRSFAAFAWKNWVKQRSYTRKVCQRIVTESPVWIRRMHHNLFPLITATEFLNRRFDHLWTADSARFEKDEHDESQNE
jgi:hypothetical protein